LNPANKVPSMSSLQLIGQTYDNVERHRHALQLRVLLSSLVRVRMGIPDANVEVVSSSVCPEAASVEASLEPVAICVSLCRRRSPRNSQTAALEGRDDETRIAAYHRSNDIARQECSQLVRTLHSTLRAVLPHTNVSCSLVKHEAAELHHEEIWPARSIAEMSSLPTNCAAEHPAAGGRQNIEIELPRTKGEEGATEILIGPAKHRDSFAGVFPPPIEHGSQTTRHHCWTLFVPYAPTIDVGLLLDRCERATNITTLANGSGWLVGFLTEDDLLWTYGSGIDGGVDFSSTPHARRGQDRTDGTPSHRYFRFSPVSELSPTRRQQGASRVEGNGNHVSGDGGHHLEPQVLSWDDDEDICSRSADIHPPPISALNLDYTSEVVPTRRSSSRHRSCIAASLCYAHIPQRSSLSSSCVEHPLAELVMPPADQRSVVVMHPMFSCHYRIVVSIVLEDDVRDHEHGSVHKPDDTSEMGVSDVMRVNAFVLRHALMPMTFKRQLSIRLLLTQWVAQQSHRLAGDGHSHMSPDRRAAVSLHAPAMVDTLYGVFHLFRLLSSMKRVHGPQGHKAAMPAFTTTLLDDIVCVMVASAIERLGLLKELAQWGTIPPSEGDSSATDQRAALLRYLVHRVATYYSTVSSSGDAAGHSQQHFTWGRDAVNVSMGLTEHEGDAATKPKVSNDFQVRLVQCGTTLCHLDWSSRGIAELFLFFSEVTAAVTFQAPQTATCDRWDRWMVRIETARRRSYAKCESCARVADGSAGVDNRIPLVPENVSQPWLCRRCAYSKAQKARGDRHCLDDALRLSKSMKLHLTLEALTLAREELRIKL
jgi:hypothetical protein